MKKRDTSPIKPPTNPTFDYKTTAGFFVAAHDIGNHALVQLILNGLSCEERSIDAFFEC